MRKIIILFYVCLASSYIQAKEYEIPACYDSMPVTCSFDEMTLSLCNEEGKPAKIVFLMSQKMYLSGGNRFGSADGRQICTVKGIKDTDPKRYSVEIN